MFLNKDKNYLKTISFLFSFTLFPNRIFPNHGRLFLLKSPFVFKNSNFKPSGIYFITIPKKVVLQKPIILWVSSLVQVSQQACCFFSSLSFKKENGVIFSSPFCSCILVLSREAPRQRAGVPVLKRRMGSPRRLRSSARGRDGANPPGPPG